MNEKPTLYGRIHPLNKAWQAKLPPEEILEPALPMIDTHHHLWDRLPAALPQGQDAPDNVYLLDEFAHFKQQHEIAFVVGAGILAGALLPELFVILFFQKGLLNATTQQIADEAGVNRALIHYYFRSRDLMLDLLLEETLQRAAVP